jgi:UDP-N-acetylglucosamine diphosphorylase / glucose-1-phosphate thymidylyltransferase / UDP-N-acetylgalactosamine diphosphorylase / glucosamine-1-phosphate N-acetyltransferase / galactosamine-1-phosphate N-acetyltransferase
VTILVFEDSLVPQLAPITTARAACAVTVGSYKLLDLLRMLEQPLVLHLRKHLRVIYEQEEPGVRLTGSGVQTGSAQPVLALNARVVPSIRTLKTLQELLQLEPARPLCVRQADQIAAVIRPQWSWQQIEEASSSGLDSLMREADGLEEAECSLDLMSYPHEVIAANMEIVGENLEHRLLSDDYVQAADGVFLARGAQLGEYVLTETRHGPIVIDEDASIGPYTLLRGPIYIGKNSRILEHAAIKDQVSLGHTTKIGGEVEAAIVEPFTNKQHHGFLGHSYLGSWINLGAGTCNSDLKNTYGTVNMEYPSGKAATGMQFLGCVMGDYSKTAINTGIFTGKVIGVCSMMYGFVTSNVPSFVNYARLFGQLATLPPDVMIATQQRMFARRKVQQRDCDIQLIHDMYRLTQGERDRFGEEIVF